MSARNADTINELIGLLKRNAMAGKLDESKHEVKSLIRVLEEHGDTGDDTGTELAIDLPGNETLLNQHERIMTILQTDRVIFSDDDEYGDGDWGE